MTPIGFSLLAPYMYYKLSNTAKRERIEKQFEVSFKYPNLYRPEIVINGLHEATLPILTNQRPDIVSLAIWGMLPDNFEDDWLSFQEVTNTLNIDEKFLEDESWYSTAFKQHRCLIIVTGFFTNYLQNGVVFPYYVGFADNRPFHIAGIYNTLNDGFLSCSLLTGSVNTYVKQFQNLGNTMPIVIPDNYKQLWLENDIDLEGLRKINGSSESVGLKANPVAWDFFKNNISYDSMLNPVDYPDIPKDI